MATDTHILIIKHGSDGADLTDAGHRLFTIGDKLIEAGFDYSLVTDRDIGYGHNNNPMGAKLMPAAILLHITDRELTETDCAAALADIRYHYDKSAPIIGLLPDASREDISAQFSSSIFLPAHPTQVLQRISSVLRLSDIRREVALRLKTLKTLNSADTPDNLSKILEPLNTHQDENSELNKPLRILFIGKASTEFMTIMNAMQERNIDFIAAFTSFTAFDYLHDERFDGVIINAEENFETAQTIATTMRRNTALFNVPALALASHDAIIDTEQAFDNGLNDILMIGTPSNETAGRILELAHFHRSQEKLKSLYATLAKSDIVEADTGLYRPDFFKAHIGQNYQIARAQKTALTLAVFKTKPIEDSRQTHNDPKPTAVDPSALNAALRQIGSMIHGVVRVQDCAARLSPNQFAILFPGKDEAQVTPIAQRICDMISCTAFDDHQKPFQIELDMKIVPVKAPAKPAAAQEAANAQPSISDLAAHEKRPPSEPPFDASIGQTGMSA